jgi:hypothetical protein
MLDMPTEVVGPRKWWAISASYWNTFGIETLFCLNCSTTAKGRQVLTLASAYYKLPCNKGPAEGALPKCEALELTGVLSGSSCNDGLCYAQVGSCCGSLAGSAGRGTTWGSKRRCALHGRGCVLMPVCMAASCASTRGCLAPSAPSAFFMHALAPSGGLPSLFFLSTRGVMSGRQLGLVAATG